MGVKGRKLKVQDCFGKNCPLKIPHPRAGHDIKKSAFPLGCSICRSEHLEEFDEAQALIRQYLEEEGPDAFLKMNRTLHASVEIVGGKGGKKGKKGPPPMKKKKKFVFKARPAPPRPPPAELAKRAEQYKAKKKSAPAAAAAAIRGEHPPAG